MSRSRPQTFRGFKNQFLNPINHTPRGHSSGSKDSQRGNLCRKNFVGFKRLEEIAKSDTKETIAKLVECKNAFLELIQSPIERNDVFVIVIEIIAKVCQSSFDETKTKLILDICNCNFIVSFTSYLMELPYAQVKISNNFYWKDQEAFWRNFVLFCECIVTTYPTLALNKCRSLLEFTSMACLERLKERHEFVLPEELSAKLVDLRERMANFEKKKVVCSLNIFLSICLFKL